MKNPFSLLSYVYASTYSLAAQQAVAVSFHFHHSHLSGENEFHSGYTQSPIFPKLRSIKCQGTI